MRAPSAPLLLDVVVVLAFATVGRAGHAEGLSVPGVLQTAWPFLAGLLLGWAVARAVMSTRRPVPLSSPQRGLSSLWAGLVVWACAVPTGMTLRSLTDQGTAASFVVVATLTLGLGLMGWRLALRWAR